MPSCCVRVCIAAWHWPHVEVGIDNKRLLSSIDAYGARINEEKAGDCTSIVVACLILTDESVREHESHLCCPALDDATEAHTAHIADNLATSSSCQRCKTKAHSQRVIDQIAAI
jgi:hypothetical protein